MTHYVTKEELLADIYGDGEMVEIPCSRKYSNGQPVHVCTTSGLVRAKHVRPPSEIAYVWSTEVFGQEFDDTQYTARIPAVLCRQTYVAAFADSYIGLKGKTICDIGAGEGQFLEIVSSPSYGGIGFGVEPSKTNCNELRANGFECFTGTIEDYLDRRSSSDRLFDVVTIMWTLCNTASAINMLRGAYDLLKPGGNLVVAEGSRILVPFRKPLHMYFSYLPVDLHPFHFSANILTSVLTCVGFEPPLVNRYLDSDYLCVLGQKPKIKYESNHFKVDKFESVLDFFNRWDIESRNYAE